MTIHHKLITQKGWKVKRYDDGGIHILSPSGQECSVSPPDNEGATEPTGLPFPDRAAEGLLWELFAKKWCSCGSCPKRIAIESECVP